MVTKGRRRLACYHEGGHAAARWWLGFHVDAAEVLTVEEFRGGIPIHDVFGVGHHIEGAVMGNPIQLRWTRETLAEMPERQRAWLSIQCERRAEMAMVVCYAGTYAEARYLKKRASVRYFYGGFADGQYAWEIAAGCFDGEAACSAARGRADDMARAFIHSPKGWAAITAISDALFERGRVDGDEIDMLCSEAFATPFRYGAWDNTWPPTPGQIRSGFIPDRSSTALAEGPDWDVRDRDDLGEAKDIRSDP